MKRFQSLFRMVVVISMLTVTTGVFAIDYVSVDPLWEKAVMDGTKRVNDQYKTQTTKILEISALQNTMALHPHPGTVQGPDTEAQGHREVLRQLEA